MQHCSICIANALESLQCCIKPSILYESHIAFTSPISKANWIAYGCLWYPSLPWSCCSDLDSLSHWQPYTPGMYWMLWLNYIQLVIQKQSVWQPFLWFFLIDLVPTVRHSNITQYMYRIHSLHEPSQWQTTLHCNVVSGWLGWYTKWLYTALHWWTENSQKDFELTKDTLILLTHWGQVILLCVSKLGYHCSDDSLSPVWHQVIIWTNAAIFSIRPLRIYFSEILFEIQKFSFKVFKEMHFKILSAKWCPLLPWPQYVNGEILGSYCEYFWKKYCAATRPHYSSLWLCTDYITMVTILNLHRLHYPHGFCYSHG